VNNENNGKKWLKVAIIILNWNGWKDTIECLESVLRNSYPNYQIIVVDNGSTDGSVEEIKAWVDGKEQASTPETMHPLYKLSHPPVKKPIPCIYYTQEEAEKGGDLQSEENMTREWQENRKETRRRMNPTSDYPLLLIKINENLGFAGGNNVGIKYLLSKDAFGYVWLLNNDTVVDRHSLQYLMEEMIKKEDNGIAGSKVCSYQEINRIDHAGGILYPVKGRAEHIGWKQIDSGQYDSVKNVDYVTGCSMLISKKCLDSIGLLNEDYFLYFEDVDFCTRAKRNHWKILYVFKSTIYHKISNSLGNNSNLRIYYYTRNRLIFTKKYFPSYLFYVIIKVLKGSILMNIVHSKFKESYVSAKSMLDFIIGKNKKQL